MLPRGTAFYAPAGLLIGAAGALSLTIMVADRALSQGSQEASKAATGAVKIKGECISPNGNGVCNQCQVRLEQEVEVAGGGGSVIGSCPTMAAGRYDISMAIPVKLVPKKTGSGPMGTYFQLSASFAVQAYNAKGYKAEVLPNTGQMSWSWWTPPGMIVDKTDLIEIGQDAAADIAFKLADARYYVPSHTQGPAYRDGEFFVGKGAVIRLTGIPALASSPNAAKVRDFDAKTLAKVVPGHTTKAEVEALLGEPWRDAGQGDEHNPAADVWEYRGRDPQGDYTLDLEFDGRGITTLIAKIPDKTRVGTARVAPAASSGTRQQNK
jgi:hypothetical protein